MSIQKNQTQEPVRRKHLSPMASLANFCFSTCCCGGLCFSEFFLTPTPPPIQYNSHPPITLLTILTEVIDDNNPTQQVRWRSVDDAVYCAKEDRQSLLVKANYDSCSGQLAWICVMFGLTTEIWIRFTMSKENTCETQCTVSENIHNPPQKGSGSLGCKGIAGGGGVCKTKKKLF